jgi:hypothetical protein
MNCSKCGRNHPASYHLKKSIKREGFPTSSKKYKEAHELADKKEKEKYPKGYEKMKKVDAKLKPDELSGKSTKLGKVIVSYKVPKKLRSEVAYHERVENKQLTKRK